MEKHQYFNNVKFTKDEKTGYYLNSTLRIRMHRYVWEYNNGAIPSGYQVHHIDHDKSNNEISNLRLITPSKHSSMHGYIRADEHYQEVIDNLSNNARPKAIEWHSSESGKEWHREHYTNIEAKLRVEKVFKCKQCGISYNSIINGNNTFCSNACKSAHRRETGVDTIQRVCVVCECIFDINKYAKTLTCSKSCASKYLWKNKRGE